MRGTWLLAGNIRIYLWGLLFYSAIASAEYDYNYWDWGLTSKKDDFQYETLLLALKKTVPEYGAYATTRTVMSMSGRRAMREINLEKRINTRTGPWLDGRNDSLREIEKNIQVPIPIMDNLIGVRRIIVSKRNVDKFSSIKSPADLRGYTVGQGRGWADVLVYRHNHFQVNDDADTVESLIPMLIKGRFDYIAVSITEISSLMESFEKYQGEIVEIPNLVIFYPYPVIFHVSKKRPELAARLEKGLRAAREDGSLAALQQHYFAQELHKLDVAESRVIILENPFVPDDLSVNTWFRKPEAVRSDKSSH